MGKRHPNLLAWQWRHYASQHRHPTNLLLHLIAVPLFLLSLILLLIGLWHLRFVPLALGSIGLIASLALQAHGHRLEQQPAEPFASKSDALKRLLALGLHDAFRLHHEEGGIFSWWDYRMAGFRRDLLAERLQLPAAQRVDQAPGERDALAMPLAEALIDQVFGAAFHRLPHLGAETAFRQRNRLAGDVLAVEPGRA